MTNHQAQPSRQAVKVSNREDFFSLQKSSQESTDISN